MTPDPALVYLKTRREELFQMLAGIVRGGMATESELRALVAAISELDADIQRLERDAA